MILSLGTQRCLGKGCVWRSLPPPPPLYHWVYASIQVSIFFGKKLQKKGESRASGPWLLADLLIVHGLHFARAICQQLHRARAKRTRWTRPRTLPALPPRSTGGWHQLPRIASPAGLWCLPPQTRLCPVLLELLWPASRGRCSSAWVPTRLLWQGSTLQGKIIMQRSFEAFLMVYNALLAYRRRSSCY